MTRDVTKELSANEKTLIEALREKTDSNVQSAETQLTIYWSRPKVLGCSFAARTVASN